MEEKWGTSFTSQIIKGQLDISWREAKHQLYALDKASIRSRAEKHPSLRFILMCPNWLQVWNCALEHGCHGTRCGQSLLRTLCKPLFGDYKCPKCDSPVSESYYLEHILFSHSTHLNSAGISLHSICLHSKTVAKNSYTLIRNWHICICQLDIYSLCNNMCLLVVNYSLYAICVY